MLRNPATVGETYLVADREPVIVHEIFTMLREAQGRRRRLIYVPPTLFWLAFALINRTHIWKRLAGELVVDTSKLQSLGWYPPVRTFDGLRSMLATQNGEDLPENGKLQSAH